MKEDAKLSTNHVPKVDEGEGEVVVEVVVVAVDGMVVVEVVVVIVDLVTSVNTHTHILYMQSDLP